MNLQAKKENIKKLAAAIDSPATPQHLKAKLRQAKEKLEKEVQAEQPAKPAAKSSAKSILPKPRPKKATTATAAPTKLSLLELLHHADKKGWDATAAKSGTEIKGDKTKLRQYAQTVDKVLEQSKVRRFTMPDSIYDALEDDNYHLLNSFLVWNDYFKPDFGEKLQISNRQVYDNQIKKYPDQHFMPDPDVISLEKREPSGESLLEIIKSDPFYKDIDFSGTHIVPDSKRKAKPRGKRTSKDGKTYYENRENRSDHRTTGKLYLEHGGLLTTSGEPFRFNSGGAIPQDEFLFEYEINTPAMARGGELQTAELDDKQDVFFLRRFKIHCDQGNSPEVAEQLAMSDVRVEFPITSPPTATKPVGEKYLYVAQIYNPETKRFYDRKSWETDESFVKPFGMQTSWKRFRAENKSNRIRLVKKKTDVKGKTSPVTNIAPKKKGSKVFEHAKKIQRPNEKWLDAVRRASVEMKQKN